MVGVIAQTLEPSFLGLNFGFASYWLCYSVSLSLNFIICKMRIIIVPTA